MLKLWWWPFNNVINGSWFDFFRSILIFTGSNGGFILVISWQAILHIHSLMFSFMLHSTFKTLYWITSHSTMIEIFDLSSLIISSSFNRNLFQCMFTSSKIFLEHLFHPQTLYTYKYIDYHPSSSTVVEFSSWTHSRLFVFVMTIINLVNIWNIYFRVISTQSCEYIFGLNHAHCDLNNNFLLFKI